jgi:hypothetical protein
MIDINNTSFRPGRVPPELESQLFQTFRDKLPADIEDAVIYDIMATNQELIKNYFAALQQS